MNQTNPFPRMHVSLYVSDITKTVNFYNTFFGTEPAKVKPGYAKYILEQPSLIISFVENPSRVQQNFGHLGLQVETVEEMYRRHAIAAEAGLVAKEEMGVSCCYAKQDKFWANDPDGVQWEVYYFHEDAEFNDPLYDTAEASACCSAPLTTKKKVVQLTELTPAAENCCTPGSGCC